MKLRWGLSLAAALLAGCNMADSADDRESASRDRIERKERERERAARERNAAQPKAKLDQVEFQPQRQPASSTPPDSARVSRSWFAGRWTDTGDCADAGLFSPNGTFVLADGARGMWNVRDGKLVIQGTGGRSELQLRRVADNTVEVIDGDGPPGRSIRC